MSRRPPVANTSDSDRSSKLEQASQIAPVTPAPSSFTPPQLLDEPSPYEAALYHLRQGLRSLRALRGHQAEEIAKFQLQALQLLGVHYGHGDKPEQPFADRLRERRVERGLTQEQLAQLAGLSLSLLRKLESGEKPPTRDTLGKLCAVTELDLSPSAAQSTGKRLAPNWYVPPEFDAVQMVVDMAETLNGTGGALDQSYVYLDPQSAQDWIALSTSSRYSAAFRASMPFGELARRIVGATGRVGIDLVALGPGDGVSEIRLAQHLVDCMPDRPSLRIYLVDLSSSLLGVSFRHTMDAFADQSGAHVCAILGDFYNLPRYAQLHYTPARSHRRRVYSLLGFTLGNLDNEAAFVRDSLSAAASGDMLLIDVSVAYARAEVAEIAKRDPTPQNSLSSSFQRFLGGPIKRYCRDLRHFSFSWEIDAHRPVPGSYGLDTIAEVTRTEGAPSRFRMYSVRRYDPEQLSICLRGLGWDEVVRISFGVDGAVPAVAMLLKKR